MAVGWRLQFLVIWICLWVSHDMAADFPNKWWEREKKRERQNPVCYNVIKEVMCDHFCPILLVVQTNPGTNMWLLGAWNHWVPSWSLATTSGPYDSLFISSCFFFFMPLKKSSQICSDYTIFKPITMLGRITATEWLRAGIGWHDWFRQISVHLKLEMLPIKLHGCCTEKSGYCGGEPPTESFAVYIWLLSIHI